MSNVWEIVGQKIQQGEKWKGLVQLDGVENEIPVVLINGQADGPMTVIMGGIHGCEYTSIDAAIRLSKLIEPKMLRGKVAVITVANIPAYAARSIYVHPEDKKNLNRSFPGKKDGTAAEVLASSLMESFLSKCDYLIDLHGGDMNEALVPFILYHTTDDADLNAKADAFAKAFGIEFVVAGKTNGSTYEATASLNKVAILAEAGQQGILDSDGSSLLVEGSLNAMRSVGTVEGEAVVYDNLKLLKEFLWSRSEYFGAWYPMINVGDKVKVGQKAGELRNLYGDLLEEIFVKNDGDVLFCVSSLAINPGDPLFAVGN